VRSRVSPGPELRHQAQWTKCNRARFTEGEKPRSGISPVVKHCDRQILRCCADALIKIGERSHGSSRMDSVTPHQIGTTPMRHTPLLVIDGTSATTVAHRLLLRFQF
jgi:hypothetical protein